MRIAGGFDSFSQRDAECGADPDPDAGDGTAQPSSQQEAVETRPLLKMQEMEQALTHSLTYDYVRVWHETSGSLPYYVEAQIERAKQTNAPSDAIYERSDSRGRTGMWGRIGDVQDERLKSDLHEAVRRLRTQRELRNR